MYIVTVTFSIDLKHLDAFLPLISENARASVTDEPGCRQFDVCQRSDRPEEIFLYEVYDDAAAFEVHKKTPHFEAFSAAIEEMVTAKSLVVYHRLSGRDV